MYEQSKAAKRRMTQPAFLTRYFTGSGLDIGAGPDGLSRYCGVFPLLHSVRDWDIADGDAQYLRGVADASVDFVHASHCLEHMRDPRVALANWLRVVRPGGHVIVTVPDEDMYEGGVWPSRRNSDHKWTFTTSKRESWSPVSVSLIDLAHDFAGFAQLERLEVLRDFYRPGAEGDQTMGPVAECAIELVLQRTEAGGTLPGPASRNLIPPAGRLRLKACQRGLLLLDPATDEGAALDRFGEYATGVMQALDTILRPGDTAVAFEAGCLAVAMAQQTGPAGAVHAVTAQEAGHRLLTANAVLNDLDGLHPSLGPVAPDLPACRLLLTGPGHAVQPELTQMAEPVARCQPLICAVSPPDAASVLADLPAGYRAFWHVSPLTASPSWFGLPAPDETVPMLVLVPPATTLNGLPPAMSGDWRADTGA